MAQTDDSDRDQKLLGFGEILQEFVQDFSRIAAPMTRLTQKNAKFVWSDACENSFQVLNEKLTTAPVLILPNGEDKFTFYCDAFRVGLGCVLM